MDLREEIKLAETKARNLKTKKAQSKAWDKVRELEHKLFIELCDLRDTYSTFSFKATVISDNKHSMADDIMVKSPFGTLHLSPTNDVESKSWYPQTCCVEYTNNQTVIVEVTVDVVDLKLQLFPKQLIGGTLNTSKYEELCKKDDLAFFKYPTGMTGLFK